MKPVSLPAEIEAQLDGGAALAISISGGKDSQAMALALVALHAEHGWTGPVFAIHADLGRIEWRQTPGQVRKIADAAGLQLVTVRREDQGRGWDMLDRWIQRGEDKGTPWSDSKNRFCTAEMKRNPIDKYLNRYSNVVCAVGLRAEESTARARKASWEYRQNNNTRRTSTTWHPLLEWTEQDVYAACGHSIAERNERRVAYAQGKTEALVGWAMHPAYVFGNQRVSCQFCVLATQSDLACGARENPELLDELIAIEDRFDFTFQSGKSLRRFRDNTPAQLTQLALI